MNTYKEFLENKDIKHKPCGFPVELSEINDKAFEWQKRIIRWSIGKGKAAIFAGCGLGKSLMEMDWARLIIDRTKEDILILAPLMVAEQFKREAAKFGEHVTLCRSQNDVRNGINITNYEMLDHFKSENFIGVICDESSILKNYSGSIRAQITESFSNTPYKLSATATPSPNDVIELCTQAEFLGVMKRSEVLGTFFTHDGSDTSNWILKGHGEKAFWKWMCTWAVMLRFPSDIGFEDNGYDLPELKYHHHIVELKKNVDGFLFTPDILTLDERREIRRNSLSERVDKCSEIVNDLNKQWIVWCDYNDESTGLAKSIDGSLEITGSDSREFKEKAIDDFINGKIRVIVSKPSIFGWGLNLQNCHNMAFVGLSDSFEALYQAVRRCWRFGQLNDVNVHIITSSGDGPVVRNIERKEKEYESMINNMIENMKSEMKSEIKGTIKDIAKYEENRISGNGWDMYLGDCVECVSGLDDESIGFTIYSPPFSKLFSYSNSDRDMGNSLNDDQFLEHFEYLAKELYRVTQEGRVMAFHCMNIPAMKERDGYIGIKDFRGDLIRIFQRVGFIYHSEHVIWKDPLIEATRTKAIGLMHKQLCKDSTVSRSGLPDYLIAMRKPGINKIPIAHPKGLTEFYGENAPINGVLSHERWRRYASPVWMDIDQTNTLNGKMAREEEDTAHICPLQIDVIERAMELWSAEGDTVLSPFAGIGSEGYVALEKGRKFIGVELKKSYWVQACRNLEYAEKNSKAQDNLFATVD